MVDRAAVEQSLRSVREAHEVLVAFHREVIAFFRVVDEQLGDDASECPLTAYDPANAVRTTTSSMKKVEEWVPSSVGRLYFDESLQVEEGTEETLTSRAVAQVSIWTNEGDQLPECWFGFGCPGEGTKFTTGWNFGRNGLWNYGVDSPSVNTWARGKFEGNANFGVEGVWAFRRTPLVELTGNDEIRRLVVEPLIAEWK
jgi:hypothetical protein